MLAVLAALALVTAGLPVATELAVLGPTYPIVALGLWCFISLNGTTVNSAGGTTPWGSWLTCEQTTVWLSVSSPFPNAERALR